MPLSPSFHLSAGLDGPGPLTAGHFTALARLAERGGLDFVTLDDSFSPGLDALAVFARIAPATSRIGLVPTVTTTHTEPFHTSIAVNTLDWVSEGRAGWLVDVSGTEAEAATVGRRPLLPAEELWREAADTVEVAARLWDSWEDDAEIRDRATGRFVDREKLHYVDFEGPYFSVKGPSITPRPPQGRPVVVVRLDHGDRGARLELAVRQADVVLLEAATPTGAATVRASLRELVSGHGRDPDQFRVLVRVGPEVRPADWLGAVDGLHLVARQLPDDLTRFVAATDRLGRPPVSGGTLRERLGLARPVSRYAVGAAR
ncbi:LLM class flavin-dependent oxidoreductase [Kitasatospora sp. NPDC101801]|uniref:LLM class flavin-dependent oxidoreductase n=1 Tax=Kitasatospora sp. NPDC101801 TaxID=3364103 RepID=UPI0037F956FA